MQTETIADALDAIHLKLQNQVWWVEALDSECLASESGEHEWDWRRIKPDGYVFAHWHPTRCTLCGLTTGTPPW